MIGQGLGIHHPERIASLTLCNTTSQSTAWYREWVKERQAVVKEGGMAPVWEMTDSFGSRTPTPTPPMRTIMRSGTSSSKPRCRAISAARPPSPIWLICRTCRNHGTDADNCGGRRSGDADHPIGRNPRRHPRRRAHCHRRTAALLECGSAGRI